MLKPASIMERNPNVLKPPPRIDILFKLGTSSMNSNVSGAGNEEDEVQKTSLTFMAITIELSV